jgi:putative endonuclease
LDSFFGSVAVMSTSRQALGRWGETQAADFLRGKGYVILAKNVRTPYGEIDIIAQTKEMLVFVEVKTRSTDRYGPPEASITPQKREHLIASAQAYLQTSPDPDIDWRIDVIAIRNIESEDQPEIIQFENAIT